ncbi:type IV secretion system protein VirB10 [Sinorhizobium fredii]|uniref:type IV secretion system protein VirB10 n=1 Tax=Rhizobium fredii TaxID=380 RepID=UPI003516730C
MDALNEDEYRRLADSADITAARRSASPDSARKPIPKGAYALLALAGLGGLWFLTQDTTPPRRLTDADAEQFSTTTPIPPTVPPEVEKEPEQNNRVVVEPEPEVAPPPPIVTPAAPAAPPIQEAAISPPPLEPPAPAAPAPLALGNEPEPVDNSEAEKKRWERLRSPMIVMNEGNSDANASIEEGFNEGAAVTEDVDSDANSAFLSKQAQKGVTVSVAGKIERTDAYIVEGTMIRGVLETAIQSDLPGSVRAVVSEDVWSFDGRRILLPRGSRLIGEYSSGIVEGQTRVLIAWNRVVRSDGVTVQLGSIGTDTLGRSGMTGKVDRHILQRYGGAMLLTLVGGGAQYLASLGQSDSTGDQTITRVDPVTGNVITTTIQGDESENEAREIAARTISQSIQQMASMALQNSINIKPTIHVNQGERIMIFVRRDLDFSALYEDPVREKMRELRNRHVYK